MVVSVRQRGSRRRRVEERHWRHIVFGKLLAGVWGRDEGGGGVLVALEQVFDRGIGRHLVCCKSVERFQGTRGLVEMN